MHIHITGASGSGVTTLGAAVAQNLLLRHLDADNYYWLPTSPPFKEKRPPPERFAMLRMDMESEPGVVLSGSIVGYGAEVEDAFDLIVFLYLPADIRVERLRRRELELYGKVDPAFLRMGEAVRRGPVRRSKPRQAQGMAGSALLSGVTPRKRRVRYAKGRPRAPSAV